MHGTYKGPLLREKKIVALGLFHFVYTIYAFLLGVLYPGHSHLAFDCVIIACSLESIRPVLVQGCKAPNGMG